MKLIRFKITQLEGFRSLHQGFETRFLSEFNFKNAVTFNPYILAGRNGSGKSNILEALAEIFYHLDCIYLENKPEYFSIEDFEDVQVSKGFNPTISRINAYELEYFTLPDKDVFINLESYNKELAHILITKKTDEKPTVEWINKDRFKVSDTLSQKEIKSLLPDYVIGYASGDNEILSLPFFKSRFIQYDAYESNLLNQQFQDPSPESSLVFLDSSYSQAILLTNLLMWEDESVLDPFKKYVGITDINTFRLIIRTDVKIEGEELLHNINLEDVKKETSYTRSYINKLKKCATTCQEYSERDLLTGEEVLFDENEEEKTYLVLDYKVNEETKKAFRLHFYEPLQLFELFQLLLLLDIHSVDKNKKQNVYSTENIFLNQDVEIKPAEENRILRVKNFRIEKEGIENNIYTKALSDGEHQFLHALGLSLLFKDTNSLFLLDEPETHFNPDWKAKFISSIRNTFSKEIIEEDKTIREMLITTHSPFLISDSTSDYVLVFKKGEPVKRPEFQTLAASINKITILLFEANMTIGDYALSKLLDYEKRFKEGEDVNKLIDEMDDLLGHSVEKTLLIKKFLS